jgi:hypothetical protein
LTLGTSFIIIDLTFVKKSDSTEYGRVIGGEAIIDLVGTNLWRDRGWRRRGKADKAIISQAKGQRNYTCYNAWFKKVRSQMRYDLLFLHYQAAGMRTCRREVTYA